MMIQNKPPVILALDTSCGPASIALLKDGEIIACHKDAQGQKQSQRLVAAIDEMVRTHLPDYSALDALAVTTGPGAFTGIRIALAAARGLALAADKPLFGISSLEAVAWQQLEKHASGTKTLAVIDAHRSQYYVQAFERSNETMRPLSAAESIDQEELAAYGKRMEATALLPAPHMPDAAFAARFTQMLIAHQATASSHPADAFYIRPADAKPQTPLLVQKQGL